MFAARLGTVCVLAGLLIPTPPADAQQTPLRAVNPAAGKIGTIAPAPADVPADPAMAAAVPHMLNYTLKITNVAQSDVTELTPVQVSFELDVTLIGVVGPVPAATSISVCSSFIDRGTCHIIDKPAVGKGYLGTITAIAPWAGTNKITLVALQTAQAPGVEFPPSYVVASADAPLETAATYDIYFDGFTLMDTRSTSTDTVWLNMQGLITATPPHISASADACKIVGFEWCLMGYKYGDAHSSGYRATPNQSVGTFRLFPEREDDLRFLFYLFNNGKSSLQALGNDVADAFSDAGELILSAYTSSQGGGSAGSSFASQLDSAIHKLNGALFADCDGPLATDVAIFLNKSVDGSNENTLAVFTRPTGIYAVTPSTLYKFKDGNDICDRRGGVYKVSYSVHRTSWQDWPEYAH